MITTETIYIATCDGCEEQWLTPNDGLGYTEKEDSIDGLKDSDWHITDDGKTYCPACYEYDDNNSIVFKNKEIKA